MAAIPIPKGIPKIRFDYFDLGEVPVYILCNPNKEELFSLGGISERTLSAKFNTLSEISFRADEYVDGVLMPYYDYLVNKRLVRVVSYGETVAYFVITDVQETNDGISKYKEVTGQSLEVEMLSKKLVAYVSGSGIYDEEGKLISADPTPVKLEHLLDDLIYGVDTSGSMRYIPDWSRGEVPDTGDGPTPIAEKYRRFDISDKSVYDFLMTDISKEYACVFNFDTETKTIYIYDPREAVTNTDIFISHDNLIKELNVQEVTDELATCLTVAGGNNLNIININPLGNNKIYKFDYFKTTDWMNAELVDAITTWEEKIVYYTPMYTTVTEHMVDHLDHVEYYQQQVDSYSGSLAVLNTQLQVAIDNGLPTAAIEAEIAHITEHLRRSTAYRDYEHQEYESDSEIAHWVAHELSLNNISNFTAQEYIQLQPFIIESSFVDDNISITDNSSASLIREQMYHLYNSASATLLKMSEPKFSIEVDAVNFMQIKEFQTFRDQIVLGAKVTIEIREGSLIDAFLLEMDLNFDDPGDFKLIFGNRLRMDDESFKFSDLMNKAIDAGNMNRLYGQQFINWNRNYQTNVTDTIEPIVTTDGLSIEGQTEAHTDVFSEGYKDGLYINTGNYVNIITPSLLWNGYPIGAAGGGAVLEGPGIDINGITIGLGGDSFLIYDDETGIPVKEYGTLNEALAAAVTGQLVVCPAGWYTEGVAVPAGVSVIGNKTTISGSITLNASSSLKGLVVNFSSNTSNPISGIIGPSSGIAYINDCSILVTNGGGGDAYSVLMRTGDILIWKSYFQAYANGNGNALGVYGDISSTGTLDSSSSYYTTQVSGTGKGYAFVNEGSGDWYITTGKVIATDAPIGEI